MLLQERLFAQNLAVEQPRGGDKIDQQNEIGEDQELPQENDGKGHVDRIAADGEAAGGDELVGSILIDAHPKAAPKRNQRPEQQRQPRRAEEHAHPRDGRGLEEHLPADRWQMKRRREHQVKIKKSEWRDEKIRLVDFAELHRLDTLAFQLEGSGYNHPQHENYG